MNINILKYQRSVEENKPIEYNGVLIDFNETAQRRLMNAYIALNGTSDKASWTCADNSVIELSASQIKDIFTLAYIRADEIHDKYMELKERLNNGEKVEW